MNTALVVKHVDVAENFKHPCVRMGVPLPMGTHESEGGVNFSLFSRHATHVQLEFFAFAQDAKASRIVKLNPSCNHTGDMWHIWVEGIQPGQLYG